MLFLTEPLGSLCSGFITEQIGRKRSMIFAAIPSIFAWTIFYYAQSSEAVFLAGVLYGFGTGLLGAPILTFCVEITYVCNPRLFLTVP